MKLFNIVSIVFGLFTVLFISACGMKYRSHNEIIQKYVGQSVDQCVADLGAPASSTKLTTGNTVYLFVSEKTSTEKTSEIRSGNSWSHDDSGVDVYSQVKKACQTTLVASPKGKIISASSRGDACEGDWVKQ